MTSGSTPGELGGEIVSSANQYGDENENKNKNKNTNKNEDEYSIMMNSVRERIKKFSNPKNEGSICRVPSRLREHNKDAYTPRIVSIGPFHCGQEKLQEMEVHKTRYMESLFKRTTDKDKTFSDCLKEMLSIEESARSCYNEVSKSYDRRRVAEILLVDGCFLLELFLRWKFLETRGDPIFGAGTICSLQRDLALLENQIPFFVLECLFRHVSTCLPLSNKELPQLCASFFYLKLDSNKSNSSDCKHLLYLIRSCYVPDQPQELPSDPYHKIYFPMHYLDKIRVEDTDPTAEEKQKQSYELIHCVTKLRESGIKFKLRKSAGLKFKLTQSGIELVKGTSENLFDIKFCKGRLEMPKLRIDDTMDSLLRNMIAFEQCFQTSYHITSFAILMDCLIDSQADIEFLQHKRIIENYLGHGEEVSDIFNKISKKVFVEDFCFAALCEQVNKYGDKSWHKKREIFVRDYWYSPWKFIGVVAGSILLLLTVLQTGYTIASYYPHPN